MTWKARGDWRARHGHLHGGRRGPPMHVRLFWWFGLSILMMGVVASAIVSKLAPVGGGWDAEWKRLNTFVEGRFRPVWHDERARDDLAGAIAQDLDLGVVLRDDADRVLFERGPRCARPAVFGVHEAPGGRLLGNVSMCYQRPPLFAGRHVFPLALGGAGAVLWAMSLFFARRLGRPLRRLARVAEEIGDGNLSARAGPGRRDTREVRLLAAAINDMAERIERQISDQRELVAAVSHEIRAPLSRLRVLVEILASRGADSATVAKIDREVVEIDSLVGDLLASSRLDFSLMSWKMLDAGELAVEALDRAGVAPDRLVVRASDLAFEGDATLVARALANMLGNAERHGGAVDALLVRDDGDDTLAFEVTDRGPGFSPDVLPRAFEAFQRGQVERRGGASLGLGLALVRRIAEAHGGAATAENRPEGGARVVFTVARRRRSQSP